MENSAQTTTVDVMAPKWGHGPVQLRILRLLGDSGKPMTSAEIRDALSGQANSSEEKLWWRTGGAVCNACRRLRDRGFLVADVAVLQNSLGRSFERFSWRLATGHHEKAHRAVYGQIGAKKEARIGPSSSAILEYLREMGESDTLQVATALYFQSDAVSVEEAFDDPSVRKMAIDWARDRLMSMLGRGLVMAVGVPRRGVKRRWKIADNV